MYNQDFIMRQIEGGTDLLAVLLLGRTTAPDDTVLEHHVSTQDHDLLIDLRFLLTLGQVNQAENLLFDYLEQGGGGEEIVRRFYHWLDWLSDDELDRAGFSREEIRQGRADALALLRR